MSETLKKLNAILDPKTRPTDPKVEAISSGHLQHAETVVCADGFKMSVQASKFHYCSPRDSHGPWVSVEVGFPSERVDAFMPFIDGGQGESPTENVYGYVPIEIVARAIDDHGGFFRYRNARATREILARLSALADDLTREGRSDDVNALDWAIDQLTPPVSA